MILLTGVALAAFVTSTPRWDPTVPLPRKVALPMDHYYSLEEIHSSLEKLARAYPDLVHLETIGQSRGGHDLVVATVSGQGEPAHKPAMYIDGNMHGNEIQGGEACLHVLDRLTIGYGVDPFITDLLDHCAFYIHPVVNPDSRVRFFEEASTPHSPRWNGRPWDNDGDGQEDEDGPEDLDGDGRLVMMRIADSDGGWVESEKDARVLRRRHPDEPGRWRMVYSEGIDNDGDGDINEDPEGGIDLNRNFPTAWKPPHVQFGAGPYALSEPEALAIAQFLSAHSNVAAVQSFHNAGNMILRPPAYRDDGEVPSADQAVYDQLAARGKSFLPDYSYLQTFEGLYAVHGGLLDWCYEGLGVFTFTNELWRTPSDEEGWVGSADVLAWLDVTTRAREWVDWHPFEHPQLGPVEIGGLDQWAQRVPPPELLFDLVSRNALFCLDHADQMPRLSIDDPRVKREPGDVSRIRVRVRNSRMIPTNSGMAALRGIAIPDTVFLELPRGHQLIGAGAVSGLPPRAQVDVRQQPFVVFDAVPGLGAVEAEFLVLGPGGRGALRVGSRRGGRPTKVFLF